MQKVQNKKKEDQWCIDIYAEELKDWMMAGDYTFRNNLYGSYVHIVGDLKERNECVRRARRERIRYRYYEKRWDRSSNYRNVFLAYNKPPYRCRYCNKKLNVHELKVDHIIPVEKAKSSSFAKKLLRIQHIDTVNDIRNLAPACSRCNRRKGSRMGFWILRAKLGKYSWYWIWRRTLIFMSLGIAGYLGWLQTLQLMEYFR